MRHTNKRNPFGYGENLESRFSKLHFSHSKLCQKFKINCRSLKMLVVVYYMYIFISTRCFYDILKNRLLVDFFSGKIGRVVRTSLNTLRHYFLLGVVWRFFLKEECGNVHSINKYYQKKTESCSTKNAT